MNHHHEGLVVQPSGMSFARGVDFGDVGRFGFSRTRSTSTGFGWWSNPAPVEASRPVPRPKTFPLCRCQSATRHREGRAVCPPAVGGMTGQVLHGSGMQRGERSPTPQPLSGLDNASQAMRNLA